MMTMVMMMMTMMMMMRRKRIRMIKDGMQVTEEGSVAAAATALLG